MVSLDEEKCEDRCCLVRDKKDRHVVGQLLISFIHMFTQQGVMSLIGGGIYPIYSYIGPLLPLFGVNLEVSALVVDSSYPLILLCIILLRSSAFDYRSLAEKTSFCRFFFSCVVKGVLRAMLFVLAVSTLFPFFAGERVAKYNGIDFMSMLQPGAQACVYNCLLRASTNHSDA